MSEYNIMWLIIKSFMFSICIKHHLINTLDLILILAEFRNIVLSLTKNLIINHI